MGWAETGGQGGAARILIVEDNPLVAAITADMVESLGRVAARIAPTLRDGLAACAADAFDLALVDRDLGGLSSAPIVAALAAAGKPVLVATGDADRDAAGFEHLPTLAKPYTRAQLAGALDRLLGA